MPRHSFANQESTMVERSSSAAENGQIASSEMNQLEKDSDFMTELFQHKIWRFNLTYIGHENNMKMGIHKL